MRVLTAVTSIILFFNIAFSQTQNIYEIYAIEYAKSSSWALIPDIAIGANSKDSTTFSYYVWFLKGDNGRNILVDVGFMQDTTQLESGLREYQRPDLALQRVGVNADEITDVIITHAHYDHIGGLDLFKKATVWIQKNEYTYFVGGAWQQGASHIGLEKLDVKNIVQTNLDGRLKLIDGDSIEIIPGIRVFIGSKHTNESQCLLVNSKNDKVLIASDDSWFYYNIDHMLSIPLTFDRSAYIKQLGRLKSFVTDTQLIIPGHDPLVISKFKQVARGAVKIR